MNTFKEKVLAIVRQIPKGRTMSYKSVAQIAGNIKAARAVGAILRANTDEGVPCHRVIKIDGSFGGYNGLLGEKEKLLEEENYAYKKTVS